MTDVTGRIRKRRRRTWLRRALLALAALLVVALVVAGVWLVNFSSVLAGKKVRVVGTQSLTPQQVLAVAQVPLGEPLARVDLRPAAQRVTTLEQVRVATARVVWPDTIELRVTERAPVFTLQSADGYRLVDATGQAYALSPQRPKDLPMARIAGSPDPRLLADVATVVAALPPPLRAGTVTAESRDTITITLPKGVVVVWGGAEESELKASVVTSLMAGVKARTYDVSAPSRPATR